MFEPGDILSDKYKIVEKIGMGGMGAVYKAEEITFGLGRTVAIKVLPTHLASDEKLVQRFVEEMKILAHLDHPHIVPIHAVDESNGTIYYVMKYLAGVTMKACIRRRGSLTPPHVIHVMRQIARAVSHIHKAGAIHRDIKSVNIMVDDEDNATLMDFGIAKIAGGANLTTDGEVLGTAPYMAPEQWEGRNDLRSDIYALGVLMNEMLTGAPPFHGDSLSEIMAAHLRQPPVPLRTIRPLIPEPLAEIVHRCLAKDPEARFQTANDLVAALDYAERALDSETDPESDFQDRFDFSAEPILEQTVVAEVDRLLSTGRPREAFNTLLDAWPEDMTHNELSRKLADLKSLAEKDEQVRRQAEEWIAEGETDQARQLLEDHVSQYPHSAARQLLESILVEDETVLIEQPDITPPPSTEPVTSPLPETRLMGAATQVRQQKRTKGPGSWKKRLLIAGIVLAVLALPIGISAIFAPATSQGLTNAGDWLFEQQVYGFPPLFNCIRSYKLALVYDSGNHAADRALNRTAMHLATVAHGYAQHGEYRKAANYMKWALRIHQRGPWLRAYEQFCEKK